MSDKVTAPQVLRALRARHSGDIFVPECNLGSAIRGCRRIDAFAMPKSWSPLRTIGYEIKVSRPDFLKDNKWHEYIGFVHELWFACPWGLIDKAEIPDGIGLLWLNKGGKMVRKRKAVRHIADSPKIIDTMAYILMSRAKITEPRNGITESPPTADDWADYYEGRTAHREIGRKVSEYIAKKCGKVAAENQELKARADKIDSIRCKLREVGLDPDRLFSWSLQSKVDELRGIVSDNKTRRIRNLASELVTMADELESLRDGDRKNQ